MRRTGFEQEHEDLRRLVRDWLAREVVPVHDRWLAVRQSLAARQRRPQGCVF
jgi:hypothetical protein